MKLFIIERIKLAEIIIQFIRVFVFSVAYVMRCWAFVPRSFRMQNWAGELYPDWLDGTQAGRLAGCISVTAPLFSPAGSGKVTGCFLTRQNTTITTFQTRNTTICLI